MKAVFLPRLALLLTAIPALAATPAIHEKAPDFTLSTLDGKQIRLSEATAKSTVVLVVLRGYPGYQCPACNRQVQEFIRSAEDFADAGAHVILVYPGAAQDLETRAKEFAADKKIPEGFSLALDPEYEFTNLYGLRWDAPSETAYPSTFIINREGTVVFSKVSRSHGGRTKPEEILTKLRKLKNAP